MKLTTLLFSALLAGLSACASATRGSVDTPATDTHAMESQALEQHAWLRQFLGEWTSEAEMQGEPGQPAQTMKGTESARSIGDLWIVSDVRGDSPMGKMEAVLTLGFDPERKRYVGTWIDSVYNHLWTYEGTVDATGKVLSLEADGPSFAGDGTTAKYKDVWEFKSPDHKVLTSSMQEPSGTWTTFMTAEYRRKK
jgi:hypothetical protein